MLCGSGGREGDPPPGQRRFPGVGISERPLHTKVVRRKRRRRRRRGRGEIAKILGNVSTAENHTKLCCPSGMAYWSRHNKIEGTVVGSDAAVQNAVQFWALQCILWCIALFKLGHEGVAWWSERALITPD